MSFVFEGKQQLGAVSGSKECWDARQHVSDYLDEALDPDTVVSPELAQRIRDTLPQRAEE